MTKFFEKFGRQAPVKSVIAKMIKKFGKTGSLLHRNRNRQSVLTPGIQKKGKSVPLQAWSVPESSRKLRFPDFMTTAQEGGKVVSLTQGPHLPPGNSPGTHFC